MIERDMNYIIYIKTRKEVIIPNILTIYINLTKKIQKIIKTGRVGCVQHEYQESYKPFYDGYNGRNI